MTLAHESCLSWSGEVLTSFRVQRYRMRAVRDALGTPSPGLDFVLFHEINSIRSIGAEPTVP